MLEELKKLNERRSDILWLMKVRSVEYFEKCELERNMNRTDPCRMSKISFQYYTINDEQLSELLSVVTFRIDLLTSQISLEELSGLL